MFTFIVLLSFNGIVQADLNDGLVAHFQFNGNANDGSGNGNDGIEHGGISYIEGFNNQAAIFNGVDSYIETNISERYQNGTVSVWYYTNKNQHRAYILDATDACKDFELSIIDKYPRSYIKNYLCYDTLEEQIPVSTISIQSNIWNHIVFIWGAEGRKIYVNGKIGAKNDNTDYSTSSRSLEIGKSAHYDIDENHPILDGILDELRIYNRVLSESEVQELYRAGEECEDSYDEGYEAGKQYCIDNPVVCGINITDGYTKADLDTAEQNGYERGYQAGVSSCDDSTPPISGNNCATFDVFSNTFHVPCFNGGSTMYWLDWELSGSDPIMLELKDIGSN